MNTGKLDEELTVAEEAEPAAASGAPAKFAMLEGGYVLIKIDPAQPVPEFHPRELFHASENTIPLDEVEHVMRAHLGLGTHTGDFNRPPPVIHYVDAENSAELLREADVGDMSIPDFSPGMFADHPQHLPFAPRFELVPKDTVPEPVDRNARFMNTLDGQAAAARAQALAAGSLLTAADFQRALGITRQAVSKAVNTCRMFYLDGPSGRQLYPAFFADATLDRRAIESVSEALKEMPGPSKWQFFTTPRASLGGKTPLEAIAQGGLAKVLLAAAAFRER